jgi:hypothetical protein
MVSPPNGVLRASGQRPAIGFVFFDSASWFIAIISFHIRVYADLPSGKLGLFFQIAFQSPEQVWGLTEIGFELGLFFRRPKTQKSP